MNKLILGLLAAATLSTAAIANDRTEEGTIASRNVYNGAVWADQPMNSDTQGFVANQSQGNASADFSIDPRTGIRDGNDSK